MKPFAHIERTVLGTPVIRYYHLDPYQWATLMEAMTSNGKDFVFEEERAIAKAHVIEADFFHRSCGIIVYGEQWGYLLHLLEARVRVPIQNDK